jgi:hypothetical protein
MLQRMLFAFGYLLLDRYKRKSHLPHTREISPQGRRICADQYELDGLGSGNDSSHQGPEHISHSFVFRDCSIARLLYSRFFCFPASNPNRWIVKEQTFA